MLLGHRPHIVHRLVAGLVMLGGAFDILDGLWTRHHILRSHWAEWLPLEVHHGSRALLVLSGVLLIALGRGLGRGKRRAWQLATGIVSGSLVLHSAKDIQLAVVVPQLLLLAYLILARRSFIAGSDPIATRHSLLLAPALLLAILVYGSVGQYHLRHQIHPPFSPGQAIRATLLAAILIEDSKVTPMSKHAEHFLDSIAWLSVGSVLVVVWLLLRPVVLRRLDPSFAAAQQIIHQYGCHSLASFAAEPDNNHFLTARGDATVAYRVSTGTAITVGDPIGPAPARERAIDEFLAFCRKHDWLPCFYEVASADLELYRARGLRILKIAEEAIIRLGEFNLNSPQLKKVRNSITKVERERPGIRVELLEGAIPEDITDQLQVISEQWLLRKGKAEMGFTTGRFDPAKLGAQKLFIALTESRMMGFVTWRSYAGGGVTLDLMRYATDAPYGLMDYLVGKSLLHFQNQGLPLASLGNAPLANVSPEDGFTLLDRGVKLLFENVRGIYEYKSLFHFKKKFNPQWEGRYLVFPSLEFLPRIALAILRVHRAPPLQRKLLGAA
jgi:phosphatidylglycerol lysyltransferase